LIDNKIKGKSFSGCVKYVMNQPGAEMLDTNMSGRNPNEIIAEFQLGRLLNSNVKNIVFHASMSAAPGEELSNDKWKALARDYLKGMGFDDNQYIAVRHHEPEESGKHDHAHVHIVASRVKLTGECVSDSWDYQRSNILMKELESQYDLVPTPHHLSNQKERHNARKGEMQLLYKQQRQFEEGSRDTPAQPSARMKLQALIDGFTAQPTTMTNLIEQLQSTGVEVRIRQTRNGVIQGISFAHPDWEHGLKGCDLGSHYTWQGLQAHKGVSYDPVRDAAVTLAASINSRASTTSKMAAKRLQSEVADGIARTASDSGAAASSRIGSTGATTGTSQRVERSDRPVEPAASSPTAADLQSDPGKQRLTAAVSQLHRSAEQLTAAVSQLHRSADDFSSRLEQVDNFSRKRAGNQSERELATAPIGAGSENRAVRAAAKQPNIASQLDQLGAAVEQFNAEFELQLGGNPAAGNDSRTESGSARPGNSTASTTTGWNAADIQRQFEEISRIHDGIRSKLRASVGEFEEYVGAYVNKFISAQLDSIQTKSISAHQHECTSMLAPSIDNFILDERDRYVDDYYTAERISPNEVSLRSNGDNCEILRARRDDEDVWEALPIEREMTESEIHDIIGLTEELIKQLEADYWQEARVDIVAPIVADILRFEGTTRSVGEDYTMEWDSPLLLLWETGNPEPIMQAEWDNEQECWYDIDSKLTAETAKFFSEIVAPALQLEIKQKQESAATSHKQNNNSYEMEL